MSSKFTQSFKIQAVEKALSRNGETSLRDVSDSLGVSLSPMNKWDMKSRNQEFEPSVDIGSISLAQVTKEKRPQDWSMEERLQFQAYLNNQLF